jgi:hypothetical protein
MTINHFGGIDINWQPKPFWPLPRFFKAEKHDFTYGFFLWWSIWFWHRNKKNIANT